MCCNEANGPCQSDKDCCQDYACTDAGASSLFGVCEGVTTQSCNSSDANQCLFNGKCSGSECLQPAGQACDDDWEGCSNYNCDSEDAGIWYCCASGGQLATNQAACCNGIADLVHDGGVCCLYAHSSNTVACGAAADCCSGVCTSGYCVPS